MQLLGGCPTPSYFLSSACLKDDYGEPTYGKVAAEDLYGPQGWCEAFQPQ